MKRKTATKKKTDVLRERSTRAEISVTSGDTNSASAPAQGFREVLALIERARQRAYHAVNTELIGLYWQIIYVTTQHLTREQLTHLRACFENISGGLAAGRGGWLRCSSVEDPQGIFSFVAPRHPPRRARNPLPDLFSKHALNDEIGSGRSLLICCAAFCGKPEHYPNLEIKKIPKAVPAKCEWGHDDYSLKIENLPKAPPPKGQQQLF